MQKIRSLGPALAGCLLLAATTVRSVTVTENFSGNPLTNGWSVFGHAGLFAWDATNQNLRVTWDSTRTNSYFHQPLGFTVTRHDDFQIEFDLTMDDCISGHEPGKTGPLQIGIGLLNLADATSADFGRGSYGGAPNLAEFNYFPYGYYTFGQDIFPSDPTTVFDFVSSSGFGYAPTFFDPFYEFELPTNQVVRVTIAYKARNQSLLLTLTTNQVLLYQPPAVVLNDPASSGFSAGDDFRVDTFSISSYSSYGDAFSSVLGHGTVDNITVHVPPVQDLTGAFSNQVWQAQFRGRSNWLYTLERTVDWSGWTNVSATVSGNATNLFLPDTNPPAGQAFYRVRAQMP
jgi:hypothetical protein